jgi:hypothetical protein
MAVAIFRMMVLALVTVLISLPRAVDFFASEWTQQAIDKGWIPTRWERVTYYILCAVAFIQFLVGFVVLSHITVWLFWLIF